MITDRTCSKVEPEKGMTIKAVYSGRSYVIQEILEDEKKFLVEGGRKIHMGLDYLLVKRA